MPHNYQPTVYCVSETRTNMKKLYISFLWHMHQPMYKDLVSGRVFLPWVRLHSLKGYYDMPAMVKRFPTLKVTFNLTSSLISQLAEYVNDQACTDEFLEMTRKSADELTNQNKHYLLSNFFMNNWQTIITLHPHYNDLLRKRGHEYNSIVAPEVIKRFTTQDFLDLQVLFNLHWFGYTYRNETPEIKELMQKEKGYTEADKAKVLEHQFIVLRKVLALYKELRDTGQIEISTSPYYHPILPILYSGTPEYGYDWPVDVIEHLDKAIQLCKRFFGCEPKGFWPSEGALSRSILPFFTEQNVEWLATDEDILFQTLGQTNRIQSLYKPYSLSAGGKDINIFFRDKKLSDLIGFSYANSDPEHAADDFMSHLDSIYDAVSGLSGNHVVPIILDGENPWEFYRDGGEKFLSLLYEKIVQNPNLETITLGEYIQKYPSQDQLNSLHAGSWINHNFDIWYGHEEDKKAWTYLNNARQAILSAKADDKTIAQAWEELYIAQGSDWFWWFGDEFSSSTDDVFDFMFRAHLRNVYTLLSKPVPKYLNETIKSTIRMRIEQEPLAFINPTIDGAITSYYEWEHAGVYTLNDMVGTMHTSQKSVERIYFGFNLKTLFFRIDFPDDFNIEKMHGCFGCFDISTGRKNYRLSFTFAKDPEYQLFLCEDENKVEKVSTFCGAIGYKKIVELSCDFDAFGVGPKDDIHFSFFIVENDVVREKWPKFSSISIQVPDVDFEDTMWSL